MWRSSLLSDVDFENRVLKSFFKVVNQSMAITKKQKEIKSALVNDPETEAFKGVIEKQELSLYGFQKDEEDIYLDGNQQPISIEEKAKIQSNIELRMITESPKLNNLGLMNMQGKIILDSESIKNAVRRGEGKENTGSGY